MQSKEYNVDATVGAFVPHFMRAEIAGPLGIKVGLFVMNEEWVQLFVPRENKVFRFPTDELARDSVRRDRFLSLLPLPIVPQLYFESLLTRSGLPDKDPANLVCELREAEHDYQIRWTEPAVKGAARKRELLVDASTFHPMRFRESDVAGRDFLDVRFSKPAGEGTATFPRKIEIFLESTKRLTFTWKEAELWQNITSEPFDWKPPPGAQVQDF